MPRKIWIASALVLAAASALPMTANAQPAVCEGGSANVNTVYFTPGSADGAALTDQLKYVVRRLGATGTAVVTGRIDASEKTAGLDKARADTVVKRLVELGVKAEQLQPAAGGPVNSGEALTNRRVEVCIKGAVYPPPA